MPTESSLGVLDQRAQAWGRIEEARVLGVSSPTRVSRRRAEAKKASNGARSPRRPEGWQARLREQSHHLARALELLEQASTMAREPKSHALAHAQCLRAAGLITMVAASELLVIAGWFEAAQAIEGGTLEDD